jgi:hypothetical protein
MKRITEDEVMTSRNTHFLSAIDGNTRAEILDSIAAHYGITSEKAYAEVTGDQAEDLLDYLVEPLRGATSVLMRRRGL